MKKEVRIGCTCTDDISYAGKAGTRGEGADERGRQRCHRGSKLRDTERNGGGAGSGEGKHVTVKVREKQRHRSEDRAREREGGTQREHSHSAEIPGS